MKNKVLSIIRVTKTPEGQEDYDQNDVEQTGLIGILLKAGFGHEDAKRYLELEKDSDAPPAKR